jgi:hypothetical protein
MNDQERSMIEGLFQRLQQAEAQAGPRDAEADALIKDLVARQPAAPYLLAQVVLMQEQGLRNLQTRVEELERDQAERPQGGFLGGLFGGSRQPPSTAATPQPVTGSGWSSSRFPAQGAAPVQAAGQGGGFMAGALQTAMGVAGGVLLGNAVAGLFAGDAHAAQSPAEAATAPPEEPETPESDEDGGLFGGLFGGDDDGF